MLTDTSTDSRTQLRAVVVDDSRFMRAVVTRLLEESGIAVVAEAVDGVDAIEVVAAHRPDVVTMDIEMPRMNGIEAVERIMADCPTPIVILSAYAAESADVTFEALERGAVDFFTKPGGERSGELMGYRVEFAEKVRSAAAANTALVGTGAAAVPRTATTIRPAQYVDRPTLVVGASTGGPGVVEQLLRDLPVEADLRVLVVQHMPAGFTERFAARLDTHSGYRVREARAGDTVRGGEVLVAPGGSHLVVTGYDRATGTISVDLDASPAVHGVRPAIDLTMASAAEHVTDPLVGVVLTGMGQDGVVGLQAIRGAGGETVVQDEATSVVFGMPKRAIEAGCADHVVAGDAVAAGVAELVRRGDDGR